MQESVTCPSCFARYGLRSERVNPDIKRAQCFKCNHVFSIEAEVLRLLQPIDSIAFTMPPFEMPAPPIVPMKSDVATQQMKTPPPAPPPSVSPKSPANMDLGNLEESFLETQPLSKTAPDAPGQPSSPAQQPPAVNAAPSAAAHQEGSGAPIYASAKDAISKLLGAAPEPAPVDRRLPTAKPSSPMDVEATLDALENTLGGINPKDLEGPSSPSQAPVHAQPTKITMPQTSPQTVFSSVPPPQPQTPLAGSTPLSSLGTVKLTNEEIRAAMAAGQDEKPIRPQAPQSTTQKMPTPLIPAAPPPHSEDLLRVKVGSDLYQNLTHEKMVSLIEEGRVQDWHLVARQHSENWIEAGKVPALRHVFEDIKRRQSIGMPAEAPPAEPATQKRSLFSGLFGRH